MPYITERMSSSSTATWLPSPSLECVPMVKASMLLCTSAARLLLRWALKKRWMVAAGTDLLSSILPKRKNWV